MLCWYNDNIMCLLFCFVCLCVCVLNCYDSMILTFCEQSWSKTIWSQAMANLETIYINNSGKSYLVLRKSWKSHVDRSGLSVRKPLLDGSLSKPAALFISWQQHRTTVTCFWTSGCQALFGCTFWWNLVIVAWMGGNLPLFGASHPNGVVG